MYLFIPGFNRETAATPLARVANKQANQAFDVGLA
jgi:hypothetical protein